MNLMIILNEYFHGEKVEALIFILSVGVLCIIFGTWLLTEGGDFFRGVALPFLAMGLIMGIVGSTVGFRTSTQLKNLETGLISEKEATIKAEIMRMDKVNRAWPKYLAIWIAFGVIGLALRLVTKNDFAQGLGIALVFFSGLTLLIDGFAERRAKTYSNILTIEAQSFKD